MIRGRKISLRILLPLILVICLTATPVMAQAAPEAELNNLAGVNALLSGGLFKPYQAIAMPGAYADAVGIGDFNSDGRNDVAVTDSLNATGLWVFLQNPDGTLASPVKYATGLRPETLAVGDLNHDGRADIAVGNFGSSTIGVFLQKDDGTLSQQVTYPTSTGPDAIAIADLNNDGRDDIAVSHWTAPILGVFFQQEGGTLAPMTSYPSPQAGYDDIDTGDFNHDGLTDIVKMSGQGYANPNLSVYLQIPGGFQPAIPYDMGDVNSDGVAAGDLTGEGIDDIALVYGGNRPSSKVAVLSLNNTGSLSLLATYPSYDIPEPAEIADVDLDGRKDLLTLHGGWYALGIYLQDTSGGLASEQLYSIPYASHYGPQGFDVGDINGDGCPDVVIGDYNSGLVILYSNLAQDFSLSASPASQVIESGKTGQVTITVTGNPTFNTPVSLSVDGLPGGVTTDIVQNPITPPGTATLTLTVDPGAETGAYPLQITGIGGTITHTTAITIQVGQPITGLTASNNGPTQVGSPTGFTAAVTSGSNVNFAWEFGDGTTGQGATVFHTYSQTGTYTATVKATNEVTVNPYLVAETIVSVVDVPITGLTVYTQNPALATTPTSMRATITSGTNVIYHWNFGDGTTADGAAVSHVYKKAGNFQVVVTAVNSVSSATRSFTLQVKNPSGRK